MSRHNKVSLSLPQMEAAFGCDAELNSIARRLIVLGGRAPDAAWLRSAAEGRAVWAADHGADACKAAGIVPDRALGDFDSIGKDTAEWLERRGVNTERFQKEKDYTDFQLCLRAGEASLVTGCWGGRFDHAFSNIFSALWDTRDSRKTRNLRVLAFADECEILIPVAGEAELNKAELNKAELELEFKMPPLALSLLPLTGACRGVDIHGTKWELSDAELLQSRPCAVSNAAAGSRVTVRAAQGVLGVYCLFREV